MKRRARASSATSLARAGAVGMTMAMAGAIVMASTIEIRDAGAQPRRPMRPSPSSSSSSTAAAAVAAAERAAAGGPETSAVPLRAQFGVDAAARMLDSSDVDERRRGVARAASLGTPEALALLKAKIASVGWGGRTDPRDGGRSLLDAARALGPFAADAQARDTLQAIANVPASARATVHGESDESAYAARLDLARRTATRALARVDDLRANEALVSILRASGPGQAAAAEALAGSPPVLATALLSPGATPPIVLRAMAATGDLRLLEPVRAAISAPDAGMRAAAIAALGALGDARVADAARDAMSDRDPVVRAAAAEALVAIAAPERQAAVELLLGDDATAMAGIALAARVESPAIVKALIARATAIGGGDDAANGGDAESDNRGDEKGTPLRSVPSKDRERERERDAPPSASTSATPSGANPPNAPTSLYSARNRRTAAIAALGTATSGDAVRALAALVKEPLVAGDAAEALARSPSPDAPRALEALGAAKATAGLALRALATRERVRGETSDVARAWAARFAASADPRERALGVSVLVMLHARSVGDALGDGDPRVRRAAAVAALGDLDDADVRRALLARRATETDEATRTLLSAGLADGDPEGRVTTLALVDRAESGGADAPLAALALARRADAAHDAKVDALLGSRDPILRAHAARGLGGSAAPDATGRLAAAYASEPDVAVRRALLAALAARTADADAPARRTTLDVAAAFDPDGRVRWIAARAIAAAAATRPVRVFGARDDAPYFRGGPREVAWLRIVTADGASGAPIRTASGAGAPPPAALATLVASDGVAVPIAFDDDGYALVPGISPGEARVLLAPRVPLVQPPSP